MNTQTAAPLFTQNKAHKLKKLLSFVAEIADSQTRLISNGNILEIGSGALLSRPCLRTAVHFDSQLPQNADIICDENLLTFSAAYDLIISPLSLHFAKSPKTHLNQLISILKPGGQLVLTTFGHYSLHEIRTVLDESSCLELFEFIHPAQLKSWLPPQGERDMKEDWITLTYETFSDFIDEAKELNLSPFRKSIDQLNPDNMQQVSENFDGTLTFQIITVTYKKPHLMRDE